MPPIPTPLTCVTPQLADEVKSQQPTSIPTTLQSVSQWAGTVTSPRPDDDDTASQTSVATKREGVVTTDVGVMLDEEGVVPGEGVTDTGNADIDDGGPSLEKGDHHMDQNTII